MRRVLALSLLSILLSGCGNAYVSHNKELLKTIPLPPGATKESVTSYPYYSREDEDKVSEYVTTAVVRLDGKLNADRLFSFYQRKLADWGCDLPQAGEQMECWRKLQLVSIDLGTLPEGRYSIKADYHSLLPHYH